METRAERWGAATWIGVALAAGFAASQSWRATSLYGLGLDGDATWTLSAGTNLARGRGLVTCLGEVFSLWPPLYPSLVALAHGLGLDVLFALRVVQVAALAFTVGLGARLAFEVARSRWASIAAAGSLALSPRLHEYTVQTVSESLFVPLALAALLAALRWRERPVRSQLAWVVLWSALACLQRYLGVTVVAAVAAFVVGAPHGVLRERVGRAALYAIASLLPLAAWFVRNRMLEDAWTGGRTESAQSFFAVASDAGVTVLAWSAPNALPAACGAVVIALATLAVVLVLRRAPRSPGAMLLLGFATVYTTALVALASIVLVDRVGDRLMLPALPAAVALAWGAAFGAARARAALLAIAALTVLAWSDAAPALWTKIDFWQREGAGGFHSRAWKEHPISRALASASLREPVWSNAPEMVWLETGLEGRFLRPMAKAWDRAGAESAERGGSLVWFQREGRPRNFVESLGRASEPLANVADGLILALPASTTGR